MLERRKTVANLYLRGTVQWKIAHELGKNQATISRDLAAIRKEWLASAVMAVGKRQAQEIAKIDRLEEIATAAWERSCQDNEKMHATTTKGRTTQDGEALPDLQKTGKTVEGRYGDPRFLERIAWCIDKRCEILGLNAGKKFKHEVSGEVIETRRVVREFWINMRDTVGATPEGREALGPLLERLVLQNEQRARDESGKWIWPASVSTSRTEAVLEAAEVA